jgi:branched-chain amino acid transport system permease protein
MLYRYAGRLPTSYAASRAVFDHPFDRSAAVLLLVFAGGVLPLIGNDYLFEAVLMPFLALSLAAVGLNLLTGYAGQVSLGTAAFMAVGAFSAYNIQLRIPELPLLATFVLAGLVTAGVGLVFGLPSLRLKGFYLAVSTLAAQFFVQWVFTKFGWFSNYSPSGVISAPHLDVFGIDANSPVGRYLLSLGVVVALTWVAVRLARTQTGRNWIAVRDAEVAATIIGVPVLHAKLLAFAISSFYAGVAGVLWAFCYLRTVEPAGFDLERSFQVLFIIIIGGLASTKGAFFGSAFIVVFPLLLSRIGNALFASVFDAGIVEVVNKIVVGALIIAFLIAEPAGLAALWSRFKLRLKTWPFAY